jgi:uncharacterized protein (DUF427 family)
MRFDLEELEIGVQAFSPEEILLETSPRRVRALFGGVVIADSRRTALMLEPGRLPVYYFPPSDVRTDLLAPHPQGESSPLKGKATYWSIAVDGRAAEKVAWSYRDPPRGCPNIGGYFAFYWRQMDAWFEEDEEMFGHAKDPYKRIDVLNSSCHVEVVAAGKTVADTTHPTLLFETGLPVRYYIPKLDVRFQLLTPSKTQSTCAYKGTTSEYWQMEISPGQVKDVAWCYRAPSLECSKIANLVCFFNERVDAIYVDGEPIEKVETIW